MALTGRCEEDDGELEGTDTVVVDEGVANGEGEDELDDDAVEETAASDGITTF